MLTPVKPVLAPQPTTDDRHYWDGDRRRPAPAAAVLASARPCATHRGRCAGTATRSNGKPFPSDCRATVISWIIPRHPPVAEGDEQLIALVETTEGARLVVNLHDFPLGEPVNDARIEIFMHDVGDGVILPQGRPLQTRRRPDGPRRLREGRHRRHRPHRILQEFRAFGAAARRGGVARGHPRRGPVPRRHRRHGDLHPRHQRRARADELPRHPRAHVLLAHDERRRRRLRHGDARGHGRRQRDEQGGAGLPRVQRALRPALRHAR